MQVDIVGVCAVADGAGPSALVVGLSVVFSLYVLSAISISAITIWNTSSSSDRQSVSAVAAAANGPFVFGKTAMGEGVCLWA